VSLQPFFFWQRATQVIEGWIADSTWENNSTWYTLTT